MLWLQDPLETCGVGTRGLAPNPHEIEIHSLVFRAIFFKDTERLESLTATHDQRKPGHDGL